MVSTVILIRLYFYFLQFIGVVFHSLWRDMIKLFHVSALWIQNMLKEIVVGVTYRQVEVIKGLK